MIIIFLGVTAVVVAPFLCKIHLYIDANSMEIAGEAGVFFYNLGVNLCYESGVITIKYGKKSKKIAIKDISHTSKKDKKKYKISLKNSPKIINSAIKITVATSSDTTIIMPYLTTAGVVLNSIVSAIDVPIECDINLQNLTEKTVNCADVNIKIKCNIVLIISSIFTILVNSLIATRRANERSRNKKYAR